MKKHPIEYALSAGRVGLVKWVIDIHNEVNKSLEKPTLTYDEVIEIYVAKMRIRPGTADSNLNTLADLKGELGDENDVDSQFPIFAVLSITILVGIVAMKLTSD